MYDFGNSGFRKKAKRLEAKTSFSGAVATFKLKARGKNERVTPRNFYRIGAEFFGIGTEDILRRKWGDFACRLLNESGAKF